ncbi:MAG: hypothetical protein M5U19_11575 [Microthrixaceae bacterium]|nr:hypothetical protein [Microthrixaceae bacterium]
MIRSKVSEVGRNPGRVVDDHCDRRIPESGRRPGRGTVALSVAD